MDRIKFNMQKSAKPVLDRTMRQNFKLVACDMDGTLLDLAEQISAENHAAIRELTGQGIGFTLVTGRIDRMTRPYVRQLDVSIPIIACNGAIVRDCASDAVLYRAAISPDDVREIVSWLKHLGYDHLCYTADCVYYPADSRRIQRFRDFNSFLEQVGEKTIKLIRLNDQILNEVTDIVKILAVLPDRQAIDQTHQLLCRETGCLGELSDTTMMDIMAAGVNKGTGLMRLADMLQVDLSQIAALGNHDNDVTMLRTAGLGIAMADASPAARKAARYVTGSHDQSGVAQAIRRYILRETC